MSLSPVMVDRAVVVTGPATEPITIHDAKKQVEIASSDTAHDADLALHIAAARQQWERDTAEYLISRTMRLTTDTICEMQFPHRPVTAIESIKYYDLSNTQQTLATSVYQLDVARSQLRLQYDEEWPNYLERWDSIEINYTLGSHANSLTVPAVAKRAMLLLVGYYFDANRGDNDGPNDLRAYEALATKHMRSTYP